MWNTRSSFITYLLSAFLFLDKTNSVRVHIMHGRSRMTFLLALAMCTPPSISGSHIIDHWPHTVASLWVLPATLLTPSFSSFAAYVSLSYHLSPSSCFSRPWSFFWPASVVSLFTSINGPTLAFPGSYGGPCFSDSQRAFFSLLSSFPLLSFGVSFFAPSCSGSFASGFVFDVARSPLVCRRFVFHFSAFLIHVRRRSFNTGCGVAL